MVTTFYPPFHFGGDATYVRALALALADRGHEVTVIHCEDAFRLNGQGAENLVAQDSAVKVHRLKSRAGPWSPLLTQQLGRPALKSAKLREVLEEGFDVVNFHNISLIGGPGVLKLSKAPATIYTLHEHWLLCATHIFWKNNERACDGRQCIRCSLKSGIPPQLWRYTNLLSDSLTNIDQFIAPSEFTATAHRDFFNIKADIKTDIEVIPLFSSLSPDSKPQRDTDELEFLYVGRMTASKGVDELVASFARWPQFRLTVIGSGELLQPLRERFSATDNIRFIGSVEQNELIEHYQRAQALILPSLAPETFGLTVVEAFACGTPAIVRIAGGNRETIDQSGAGYLYTDEASLKAAIDKFAQDDTLRHELGQRARAAYEAYYTQNHHVEKYLNLVDTLLHAKQSQSE